MKIMIFLIFNVFLIQFCCRAQKVPKNSNKKKGYSKPVFKVIKIDSIQNVYVIYATKHKTTVKIVSKKSGFCKNKIEIGKFYKLTTTSLFPPNIRNRLDIGGIGYEGVHIKLENNNGVLWDLFTCIELDGLCYL